MFQITLRVPETKIVNALDSFAKENNFELKPAIEFVNGQAWLVKYMKRYKSVGVDIEGCGKFTFTVNDGKLSEWINGINGVDWTLGINKKAQKKMTALRQKKSSPTFNDMADVFLTMDVPLKVKVGMMGAYDQE